MLANTPFNRPYTYYRHRSRKRRPFSRYAPRHHRMNSVYKEKAAMQAAAAANGNYGDAKVHT